MAPTDPDTTDAELLRRFISRKDQAAFTELVRRKGPMVFGVCRRMLHNVHDAEDAFQVTFLILAKNATSIRRPELLGQWLFGVACRVATRSSKARARRQRLTTRFTNMLRTSSSSSSVVSELEHRIDDAINRLPSKYRAAIVACYLEGRSNREAAQALDWPEGTLVTRLSRAKAMIYQRLSSQRAGTSLTAVGIVLAEQLHASALPPALVDSTVRVVVTAAAGHDLATMVSARVDALFKSSSGSFVAPGKLIAVVAAAILISSGLAAALIANGVHAGSLPAPTSGIDTVSVRDEDPIPALANPITDVAVLKSVQDARADAFAVAHTGRGAANAGNVYSLGRGNPAQIELAYDGEKYLTRVQYGGRQTWGCVGDSARRYQVINSGLGEPSHPPFVLYEGTKARGSLGHEPANWSVAELGGIPPWHDDTEFFSSLLGASPKKLTWSASRDKNIVSLTVRIRDEAAHARELNGSQLLVEFDMEHHGMCRFFRLDRPRPTKLDPSAILIERRQVEWKSVGEADVPARRIVVLLEKQGNAIRILSKSLVTFSDYSLGSVNETELSPGRLGITSGTRVFDSVTRSTRVYLRGDEK